MIITLDSIKPEYTFTPTTKYDGRVLLFLDFDGVLHPFDQGFKCKETFTCNYLLERVLIELPNVEVVISSHWTKTNTLNNLRQKFSEDLWHRFIGILHEHSNNRSDDVRKYMNDHGEINVPWIAVDDLAHFYDADPVVRSPYKTGMTEETYIALKNALLSPIEFQEYKRSLC